MPAKIETQSQESQGKVLKANESVSRSLKLELFTKHFYLSVFGPINTDEIVSHSLHLFRSCAEILVIFVCF